MCAHNGSQYNSDAEKKEKKGSSVKKLDKRSPPKKRDKHSTSERTKDYLASDDPHEAFKVNGNPSNELKRSKRLHKASASKAINNTDRRLKETGAEDESPSKKVKKGKSNRKAKNT